MSDESVALVPPAATAGPASPGDAEPQRRQSYRDILKSSALIGGSTAINVCIGIVRTKIMAVLLGPAGYGVMGAYMLILEMARSVAQMGLNSSGVRQIADAVASGDTERVGRTAAVLRRTSLACAVLGAAALAAFCVPISQLTFGSDAHAGSVALLGLAVFFAVIAGSQGALLQGMRRVSDLAKLAVIGGLLGTLIGVPMVYAFGEHGLAPTLVAVAASSAAATWWYRRRLGIATPPTSARATLTEASALLKLGVAFMASGLLMTGAAYVVRIIVLRNAGLAAAGAYYAAWTLGGLYIGFILQALGTDFYPRLVGLANDDEACNRLVNEQTQVSLLLAMPGVLATITAAPLAVSLFYSSEFSAAAGVLRWICLGMALRVLTWPIGYIAIAKSKQTLFFSIELAWTVVNVALTWWCVQHFGVDGAGIAFFGSYVFHGLLVYPIVRHLSGFRWSVTNQRTAATCLFVVAAVFDSSYVLTPGLALAFGAFVTAAASYVCIRMLVRLVSPERMPRAIAYFLQLGSFSK